MKIKQLKNILFSLVLLSLLMLFVDTAVILDLVSVWGSLSSVIIRFNSLILFSSLFMFLFFSPSKLSKLSSIDLNFLLYSENFSVCLSSILLSFALNFDSTLFLSLSIFSSGIVDFKFLALLFSKLFKLLFLEFSKLFNSKLEFKLLLFLFFSFLV